MDKTLAVLAAVFGFTGVGSGALGAHGIKKVVADLADGAQRLGWWDTAARYHLLHAFALAFAAVLAAQVPGKLPRVGAWLIIAGVLVFSGSLYLLTFTGKNGLVFVTPFGGLLLLAGWATLGVAAMKLPSR